MHLIPNIVTCTDKRGAPICGVIQYVGQVGILYIQAIVSINTIAGLSRLKTNKFKERQSP